MDSEVFSLAVDWMYGCVDERLELQQAAHMMRAGDRLSILGLRDASARICCEWLHCLRHDSWIDFSKWPLVEELHRYALAAEADDVAWVSTAFKTIVQMHMCYGGFIPLALALALLPAVRCLQHVRLARHRHSLCCFAELALVHNLSFTGNMPDSAPSAWPPLAAVIHQCV